MSIERISTIGMSREDWLSARRKSIGGSDAGTILGFNPYNSPYALWAEKTGKVVPEDISDKEAVRLGNDLEDYVARRFMEATGKKVRNCNAILYNPDYPFAHANPDRMVVGENAGLECKTTSSWDILQRCKAGDFPETWYCQITHYMMVTGAEKWYIAVLVFGHGFFWFEVCRKQSEIDALAEAERDFWDNYVLQRIEPPLDGTEATADAISTIYADSVPGQKTDLTAVSDAVHAYMAAGKQIKELKELQDKSKATIQAFMQDSEKGELAGFASVSWAPQSRVTFDYKAYEAECGKLPAQYFKTSESRVFRLNKIKS